MESKKFRFAALKISAICIIVFIIQVLIPSLTDSLLLNQLSFQQPWRFLTSIFLHGSITHLLYNLFALALFGSILESDLGKRKFLLIFLVAGILANLFSVNFYEASLGASGAIFGIIGALMVRRPGMIVWAFNIPMPMILAGIIWAIGDIIGLTMPSEVGHLAHLSGLAVGIIFGALYRNKKEKYLKTKKQKILIDENSMRNWEERHLR